MQRLLDTHRKIYSPRNFPQFHTRMALTINSTHSVELDDIVVFPN